MAQSGISDQPASRTRPAGHERNADEIMLAAVPGTATGGTPADEVSFVELINVVLRRRWLIFRSALWVAITVGIIGYAWPASYTVTVGFIPQATGSGSSTLSSLSGLAAQFGVSVPSLAGGVTPDLYVSLLETPDFLRPIVQARYAFTDDHGVKWNASYIDLYDFEGDTPGKTFDLALTALIKSMSVSDNQTTSAVSVSIQTKWPALSQQIGAKLLQLVDAFNVSARQQQAQALESFSDQRLGQARHELSAAEDSLARFQQQNRDYSNSPMLTLEYSRLQRAITLKQTVYVNLVQTYEQARIDAVRNTPSLVVVDPALAPLTADKKHLLLKVAASLFAGAVIGFAIAFLGFVGDQSKRSDAQNVDEFERLLAEMKTEPRRLPRLFLGWLRFRRLGRKGESRSAAAG